METSSSESRALHPLRVLNDDVRVFSGHFYAQDDCEGMPFPHEVFAAQERWIHTQPGMLMVFAVDHCTALVRFEAWKNEPPVIPGTWDDVCEMSYIPTRGFLQLQEVTAPPNKRVFFLGSPGMVYQLRAYRIRHPDRLSPEQSRKRFFGEGEQTFYGFAPLPRSLEDHVERFVLQFWPTQSARTRKF